MSQIPPAPLMVPELSNKAEAKKEAEPDQSTILNALVNYNWTKK